MCSETDSSNIKIDVLGLSRRAYNCLRRAGIDRLERVAAMSDDELLTIRNLGITALAEIREKLAVYLNSHPQFEPSPPLKFTPPEPPLEQHQPLIDYQLDPPLAGHIPLSNKTPIDVLDLSPRSRNALIRAGVQTVGWLAQMSLEQIQDIKNVGEKALAEITEKLEAYLAEHPLLYPETIISVETESSLSLVDSSLAILVQERKVPLADTPLSRLVLPVNDETLLTMAEVATVGDLIERFPGDLLQSNFFSRNSIPISRVSEQLNRYLTWLVEQDEATWADEVAGRGISPLHRLKLEEKTLDQLVDDWFCALRQRQQKVIRWRYGLDGEPLTLEEIGQRMGVTRQRVRQIQGLAQRILERQHNFEQMRPLTALLDHLLTEAGGLMNEQQLDAALRCELMIDKIEPVGVARLIFDLDDGFKRVHKAQVWGLARYPLAEVNGIQQRFVQLLAQQYVPLPIRDVLARLQATQFYKNRKNELDDNFLITCLRVHTGIEIDNEMCILAKWSGRRLGKMIVVLRELGKPAHYSVITERTNVLLPDQQVSAHTVHAHMQRVPDVFVRVGHGIYGLAEWGLHDDGSLANAACRVLQEAGRPLHIDVIIDAVLKTWHVMPGSVFAAIENDARFSRIGPGVYCLREQISGKANAQPQKTDFGDLYGAQLGRWQAEWDQQQSSSEFDTYTEVDKIRSVGLDFFKD